MIFRINVRQVIHSLSDALDLVGRERAIIMRHSFESYQILRRITGFEQIAQWAAFHHEGLSGVGYPFHKNPEGYGHPLVLICHPLVLL